MTIRFRPLSRRARVGYSLAWWSAVALLVWLDSASSPLAVRPGIPIAHAAFFLYIWQGIQILAGAIATAAEVSVGYLAVALQWLAARVGDFFMASGAMFARVWDAVKIVWSDAVKPALQWLDDNLKRLQAWLKDTFKPVFDFLRVIHDRLLAFYNQFVRPITDTIDFLRQVNRVLVAFHIHILDKLDQVLQQVEQRIEEPFLWVFQKLNEIWDVLDRVVTLDGLFQRLTLITSMRRYAPDWMNGFWNTQITPGVQWGDPYSRDRDYPLDDIQANGLELTRFYRGEDNRMESSVTALLPVFRQAAGIDPPEPR